MQLSDVKDACLSTRVPYAIVKWRHWLLSALRYRSVIIFTMGKVGSVTVYNHIRMHGMSPLVYHVHFLRPESIAQIERQYAESGKMQFRSISIWQLCKGMMNHIQASHLLRSSPGTLRHAVVISLVRDPVATFFSHVFQRPDIYRPFLLNAEGYMDVERVRAYCLDYFSSFSGDEDYIATWYEKEFRVGCDFDVYAHPFAATAGYAHLIDGDRHYLILQLERINDVLQEAAALLPLKHTVAGSPASSNERSTQENASIYNSLLADIVVDEYLLAKVYSTRYARHFYSDQQRAAFICKWSRPRNHAE